MTTHRLTVRLVTGTRYTEYGIGSESVETIDVAGRNPEYRHRLICYRDTPRFQAVPNVITAAGRDRHDVHINATVRDGDHIRYGMTLYRVEIDRHGEATAHAVADTDDPGLFVYQELHDDEWRTVRRGLRRHEVDEITGRNIRNGEPVEWYRFILTSEGESK